MATHSSILAWRNPWTEEPGGLPSMGLQRAGHDRRDLARAYRGNLLLMNIGFKANEQHLPTEVRLLSY